ncbi:MAG: T9SS type A sorting domain-containing protein [Bacteroidetes bacterium]|nr:T9SS type A sorting domain-containing protein [Bacteroidota bacterium]
MKMQNLFLKHFSFLLFLECIFLHPLSSQTLNTISVRCLEDLDGLFTSTQSDTTPKAWSLRLYSLSGGFDSSVGSQQQLIASDLSDGVYVITQGDSANWLHLGYVRNETTRIRSSKNSDTIAVADGQTKSIIWINSHNSFSDSIRFRTFLPTPKEMGTAKPAKRTKRTAFIQNIGNVVKCTFESSFSKDRPFIVGKPRVDSTKAYIWAQYTKAKSFAKIFKEEHAGSPRPLLPIIFKKGPLKDPKKSDKLNNKLFSHLVALKLNITASENNIVADPYTSGFPLGDLIYNEPNSPYRGMNLREIVNLADSMITYSNQDSLAVYSGIFEVIQNSNLAFHDSSYLRDTTPCYFKATVRLRDAKPPYFIIRDTSDDIVTQSFKRRTIFSHQMENYPNPFNPVTFIRFDLPEQLRVTIKVYDVLGREVADLINDGLLDEGNHEIEFDATKLSSGIYFYRLTAGGFVETRKIVVQK